MVKSPENDNNIETAQLAASVLGSAIEHASTPKDRAAVINVVGEVLDSTGVHVNDTQLPIEQRKGVKTQRTRSEVINDLVVARQASSQGAPVNAVMNAIRLAREKKAKET